MGCPPPPASNSKSSSPIGAMGEVVLGGAAYGTAATQETSLH